MSSNWYDLTLKTQLTNGQLGPGPYTPLIFDANISNQPIDWTKSYTVASVTLQNGFTANFELAAQLDLLGYQDNDIPADQFNVVFLADNPLIFDGNGEVKGPITPGNWNMGAGGKFNITGGDVVNFGIGANVKQSSGSPINVIGGGLVFGDVKNSGQYNTFQLTNAAANINIGGSGSMDLYQTGDTLIDSSANPGAIISNDGTVTLQGVTGAGQTDIAAPLQNHSTFNVNGGDWRFIESDTGNNDLSMDVGSINMNGNAQIVLGHQYTQTGGAFNIKDAKETIESTAAAGAVNFNGGTVNFTSTSGYLYFP